MIWHSTATRALFVSAVLLPTALVAQTRSATRDVRAANHSSLQEPNAHGFLNAVQVFPYAEGAVYRLLAAPERVSDVALQPGETLVSVAAGDTTRWVIGDTTSGAGDTKRTHILVKPFTAGLRTNVVIATDRRTYHLELTSTAKTAMTALSWTYPHDTLLAIAKQRAQADAAAPIATGVQIEALRFSYDISGDTPAWRPLRAFDDGQQTFVEFPAAIAVSEAPPLFLVDAKGAPELVNYRVRGRFYIVDRLFDSAELRLGTAPQQIVRIKRVAEVPARGRRSS